MIAAAQLCVLIFAWAAVALAGECGAVIVWDGSDSPRFKRAIEYTVLVIIVSGAGMIVLGVVGWLVDVVVPALAARL